MLAPIRNIIEILLLKDPSLGVELYDNLFVLYSTA